jgi:segregation and condensation protein B
VRAPERLSPAALETLAIVAYRQPIVRADIDAIRGVNSSALLKTLMERKLIRAVGRSERPGRPLEYGTTKRFLDHFGLGSVKDLPRVEDLKTP